MKILSTVLALAALFFSGCSVLAKPAPRTNYFMLGSTEDKFKECANKPEKTVFMTLLFQITQLLYELISEFILPFMLLYTLLTPPVIIWRNKKIRVKDGKIHYEL